MGGLLIGGDGIINGRGLKIMPVKMQSKTEVEEQIRTIRNLGLYDKTVYCQGYTY